MLGQDHGDDGRTVAVFTPGTNPQSIDWGPGTGSSATENRRTPAEPSKHEAIAYPIPLLPEYRPVPHNAGWPAAMAGRDGACYDRTVWDSAMHVQSVP